MKLLTVATLAVGLAVAVAGAASASTNLLTNGSFEADGGSFNGWTLTGTVGDTTPAVVIPFGSSSQYPGGAFGEPIPAGPGTSHSSDAVGTHAAYFVSDFTTETLSQTVHLDAGTYTIGFSLYTPQNGLNNPVDALFSGTVAGQTLQSGSVSALPATTWTNFTQTVQIATAGDYTTSFVFQTNGYPAKDIVVDQAFISPGAVPEPMSWALMIMGMGSLGVAMRAQRRRQFAFA
jgi:hypothetical protein